VAGAGDAAIHFLRDGMPIIGSRLRAVERPSAATVKPFAQIVICVKEPKMTSVEVRPSDPFRRWQADAIKVAAQLLNSTETNMSVAAGVGSGKTYFACAVSEIAIAVGRGDRIIVVTINRRCKRQWHKRMKLQGISLLLVNAGNGQLKEGLPPDVRGYITTYASIGSFPDLHGAYCGAAKTFVIFDEIHHLNDDEDTKWGKAARTAFDSASFRLCLSGTFFSSNGAPIPFARMKPVDGSNDVFEYDPHVTYSYGESVADGICRRVIFKPFDGLIEYKRDTETEFRRATFNDNIDPKDVGLRLWAACQTKSIKGQPNTMLEDMLFKANRQLMDLRAAGHERAGGIVFCSETGQARSVRDLLQRISGHRVPLVINDEPGSEDAIDAFAKGFGPWLVAIKMVTEGVDIPRLRVGVYLTNVAQELTYNQAFGRIVRHFKGNNLMKGDPDGEAYLYFPGDQRLVEISAKVEDEVERAIALREKQTRDGGGGGGGGTGAYQAGRVDGEETDNLVAGEAFSAEEIETAERLRKEWPNLADEQILNMIKFVRAARPKPEARQSAFDFGDAEEDEEDHDSLRRDCQQAARKLAMMRDLEFNDVHTAANRAVGINNINTATIEQLKAKRAWLREQLEARNAA
jgi:superfamily II DNA or RNA helicase